MWVVLLASVDKKVTLPNAPNVASAASVPAAAAALTLTVTNDPQGFGLSVQPVSLTVSRGSTATFDLTLVRRGGQSAAIVYSVTGLPPSATAAFDPTSATAVTVKITTTAATPPTSYPLLITGRSGTLEATVAVTLVVVAPAA